ncbi:MAG TPA: EthD family reductase [Thermoanaerobaculaceae bacterium]|nr:EthD family reductase [Thermoanaerobaculaceae bacterium]HPS77192.1 EthD family reductase [Thermoanaerobaculaceae bacterium]
MIRVSLMYANRKHPRFDMNYYLTRHMPMVATLLGSALKGATVDEGFSGAAPGSMPPYLIMTHLMFESVEAYQAAVEPHLQAITGDIPMFTNCQAVIQVSTVRG